MRRVLVTGGGGYVGSQLLPELLRRGYAVTAFDTFWYGELGMESNPNLRVIQGDIRDVTALKDALADVTDVIHLACISNDPSFELDPELGRTVNLDSFLPLVELCKQMGVKRFIYASSSSVYGVKSENIVHEDLSLEPLTEYSLYKAQCEQILETFKDDGFIVVSVRPATVCGYSRRQRFDVIVNLLTASALENSSITIFGGQQTRPNVHIVDMVEAYTILLAAQAADIQGQVFNFGFENKTVSEIAELVKNRVEKADGSKTINIMRAEIFDQRSYRVDSSKFSKVFNYAPKFTISDAIDEIVAAYKSGLYEEHLQSPKYHNVKLMTGLNLE